MVFSKLTKIVLYVVAGISLLVILFFYASPNTVDIDELEFRVEELMNPVDLDMAALMPVADTTAIDSTAVSDSTAVEEITVVEEEIITPMVSTDLSTVDLGDYLSGWEIMVYFRTDIALVWAYILFILTAIASIVFPLISVFSNKKSLIRLLIVLAGAAAVILVSYLLASGSPIDIIGYSGGANKNPGTLKMVDTTLYVTYMLFGLALASILYSIVSRVFK
jgi:hypothetical protein